ncbi:MAG: helix-turn-helix domain-containing protein [Candidatus Sulfopaludibacter sp.]|nr:helix-turn-helix domain-containing protein [Candidatus Sulfopaludibacter sp.]
MTQAAAAFARSELKTLMSQGQLLRVESLKSRIQVSLTLAAAGRVDLELGFIETGERCLRLARRGYWTALEWLERARLDGVDVGVMHARVEDLRMALGELGEPEAECGPATPATPAPAGGAAAHLTNRERDVVKLVAEGLSTKQIAARLGITFKTTACHRGNAMSKLGVQNAASLVSAVIRLGLI